MSQEGFVNRNIRSDSREKSLEQTEKPPAKLGESVFVARGERSAPEAVRVEKGMLDAVRARLGMAPKAPVSVEKSPRSSTEQELEEQYQKMQRERRGEYF